MRANREFHPQGYDAWWRQGREAAEAGKPREQPFAFAYSYEASCWLDGYDNLETCCGAEMKSWPGASCNRIGNKPDGRCWQHTKASVKSG